MLLLVPVAAVFFFGAQAYRNNRQIVAEMAQVKQLADLSVQIGALTHQTQKERGLSAGYLGSKGKIFGAELSSQHAETDRKIAQLQKFLESFDASNFTTQLTDAIEDVLHDLNQISSKRQAVSDLSISTDQAIDYYTHINTKLFAAVSTMTAADCHAPLTARISAYVCFLQAKERAGLERAVLSNTFAANQFAPGGRAMFNMLVTTQENYFAVFKSLASPQNIALYDHIMSDPVVDQVQQMRDVALAQGDFGIDPVLWFNTITQKIDLLQKIENLLADDLLAHADMHTTKAIRQEMVFGVVTVVVVIAAIITGVLIIKTVATALKAEQSARQHQAELAHVTRLSTMGEMASGLAHELNQPLGAMINFASAAIQRHRSGQADDGDLLEAMETISAQAQRAAQIVHRMRDFIRKQSPTRTLVDINVLIKKSLSMLRNDIRNNQITTQLDLADDLPLVKADTIQIEQVVVNLTRNSIEAMADTHSQLRKLTIQTNHCEENRIEVSVRDSGHGLNGQNIGQLFDSYHTTKEDGLGMGLSISRSIIESHGGELQGKENEGPGIMFHFVLPIT